MPELPEVQTICDVISPQIIGRRIENVIVHHEGVLANTAAAEFINTLRGNRFTSMSRRGKYMLLSLESGKKLTIHLRMTGGLLAAPQGYPMEKHTHVVFALSGDLELRFSDLRRFGRMWLADAAESVPGLDSLGLEPFDPRITGEYLKEKLRVSHRKIKDCLLDQTLIAGIGNIYSDEILFRAGIHPARLACSLTDAEFAHLAKMISETMAYYVEKNKIDPEEYLKTGGRDYRNTPYLQVYGRKGKPCLRCGTELKKEKIAGRGSVYCPNCQPLDEKG